MELLFEAKFKTDLDKNNPDTANAYRFIEEFGMEKYLQNVQAYVLVSIEQEMQMLFSNNLSDFEVSVEAGDVKLFNKNRDDIMRSAF